MRGNILIASDHTVSGSVVKPPKEEKKVNNVLVDAEIEKIVPESKSYSWTEYEKVIQRLKATINDPSLAEHIAYECYSQAKDGELCVKHLVGVSNAESTMFGSCGSNCFWVMVRSKANTYSLKTYADRKYGITHRVQLYVKLWRSKRTTAQKRLEGNYCTSECKFWVGNFNAAVEKLWL